ncbi:MAG TPA: acyl-ACP thioesterase domain-containing protein [Verrucomicrobiae bacterium]|nr:acyl-ACP thioesterase domain-containing protein [Verrucomicrobiae bacterium]
MAPPAEPGVWREQQRVRSYDVDFAKRATAEAICRWFVEAAWNHAEQLGIGYGDLARQNRFWVLSRLLVQIETHPTWGQLVESITWPRGTRGVFALRDFELGDPTGLRLVAGTSSWLVLDAASHRPQRLDKLTLQVPSQVTRLAIGREAQKLPELDTKASRAVLSTQARYSDIDVNGHVNSARYVGWLLDSYPADFLRNHLLRSIELNYVGETRWADSVSIHSHERSPLRMEHSITNSDQAEVCRAELIWTAV